MLKVTIYGKEGCPSCHNVKKFFAMKHIMFNYIDAVKENKLAYVQDISGASTLPVTVVNGKVIRGANYGELGHAVSSAS